MPNKVFTIPLLNGIRWVNQNFTSDPSYNTLPFDYESDVSPYCQPWQKGGTCDGMEYGGDLAVPVVLLSDYSELTLSFYTSSGVFIKTVDLSQTASELLNVTFLQYAAYIDFSSFPTGQCYGEVSYTDDDSVLQVWRSCMLDVQIGHSLTMKYEYQNSYNVKDVLFTPGNIVLQMRVEANMVGGYQPKSDRQTFDDQNYNATLLNGIPFRSFTNTIGGTGIPDWVIDKLNLIFTCDQVSIDGTFYVATNGTDFKAERPENGYYNQDGKWSIDLQSVPDFQFGQLTAGTQPTGDLVVIRKVWPLPPFNNVSASFAATGVFTTNSTLDYLQVFNFGLDTFTLLLGTTVGASDIAELEIGTPNTDSSIDLISTHDVGHGFNVPSTIYVTIPNGVNLQVLFVYDQLDAPAITITGGGSGMVQGQVSMYKELVAGYFTRDWNIATGLGQPGGLYDGCQILDEYSGKVAVGWDRLTADPTLARGQEVGNEGNEVSSANVGLSLPAQGLFVFADQTSNTDSDFPRVNNESDTIVFQNEESITRKNYSILRATTPAVRGVTSNMGAGASLNVANDGLVTLFFVKL